MKRVTFVIAVAILLVASVGNAQNRDGQNVKGEATAIASIPQGSGTVTYDTGSPADMIRNDVGTGGNLFDSANGNPLSAGSVSAISFYVGQTAPGTLYFSFFENPVANSQYFGVTGVNGGAFNAFSFTPVAVNSSFLAGVSQYLGFVSASTGGQGFHGGQIDWSAGQFNPYPGENGMVRVSGDIIGVPVELQNFNIQ